MPEERQSQLQMLQTEKLATMGSLLAGLAHEINNPLTFIYSNLEPLRESLQRLQETLPDPEGRGAPIFADIDAMLSTMEEGALRAREIVQNLRNFSYAGRQERKAVDVNEVLRQSLALLSPKWKGRLRLVTKLGELPTVQGYPGELGQLFLNLLANACDASPRRGVIRIRSSQRDGESIQVEIQDTGMGIAEENLPRIFDPFFTTKPPGEGTGLGLAIALQIARKHQGRIEVDSEWGKGTEVRVRLLIDPPFSAREIEDEAEASIPARKELRGP